MWSWSVATSLCTHSFNQQVIMQVEHHHPTPWLRQGIWVQTLQFSLPCIGEGNGNLSSVLAWRIPGTGEPGGRPSMGLHRVGYDWSDLAAAAAAALQLTRTDCVSTGPLLVFLKLWRNPTPFLEDQPVEHYFLGLWEEKRLLKGDDTWVEYFDFYYFLVTQKWCSYILWKD